MTPERFRALITAPQTVKLVKEAREAYGKDKKLYEYKKRGLPLAVFISTFDEWNKEFVNKKTKESTYKLGHWRDQEHSNLNGLCVIDFDHVDEDPAGSNENQNENQNDNASKRSTLNYPFGISGLRLMRSCLKRTGSA